MSKKPTAPAPTSASPPTLTIVADEPVASTETIATATPTLRLLTNTQGMKTMINRTADFAAIGKDNLEAFTASGKIWAAGVQDLTKQFAATAKDSL